MTEIISLLFIMHAAVVFLAVWRLSQTCTKQHDIILECVHDTGKGLVSTMNIIDTSVTYLKKDTKNNADLLYGIQNVTLKAMQEEIDSLKIVLQKMNGQNIA